MSATLSLKLDPTSVLSLPPDPSNDINQMYFDISVYRTADGEGPNRCKGSVDSMNRVSRGASIFGTNRIIRLLNDAIRKPLRAIPGFPTVGEHLDSATIQKVEEIVQRLLSQCPQNLGTKTEREERIDLWKRTYNILQAYFRVELPYLGKMLQRSRNISVKDAVALLYTKCPGSLADAIGIETKRHTREEVQQVEQELFALIREKHLTAQQLPQWSEQTGLGPRTQAATSGACFHH